MRLTSTIFQVNIPNFQKIIKKKKNLEYPCNLTKEEARLEKIDPVKHRYECWNYYFIKLVRKNKAT